MDASKAINDIKAGKIEYRLDKTDIIHVPVGKASCEEQLADPTSDLMDAILKKAKAKRCKGRILKERALTSTIGLA